MEELIRQICAVTARGHNQQQAGVLIEPHLTEDGKLVWISAAVYFDGWGHHVTVSKDSSSASLEEALNGLLRENQNAHRGIV